MLIVAQIPKSDEPLVRVVLPLSQAESIRDGLSDVICWANGFEAAQGAHRGPLSIEILRALNIELKSCIDHALKEKKP